MDIISFWTYGVISFTIGFLTGFKLAEHDKQ